MSKTKLITMVIVALLLAGAAYVGFSSRQAAKAGVSQASGHASAVELEIEETSRIVNGQRR